LKSLESILLPTLIIAGGKDLFAPARRSEEMHKKINQSELLIVSRASHNIVQEEYEILASTILEFLNKNNL
jgi:pimeloyl-ACP methyl ester carboxylesterase